MRYEEVKKRLFKESIIVVSALVVTGGLTYYLDTVAAEYNRTNKSLEMQVNTIVATVNTLKAKYTKVQKNADLYQEVLRKSASDQLTVDRDAIRKKFDQFKSRYFLSGLRLTMQPVQEMNAPVYMRNTAVVAGSEVSAVFYGINDEDAYSLLQAVQQELPGAAKITRFSVLRKNPLTPPSLLEIGRSGQSQLVDGAINFLWLGINPKSNETTQPGAVPSTPPRPTP